MRYLTVGEVIELHRAIVERTGGSHGIRDLSALESALAQPKATFDGTDLHPTIADKASALGFSLVANHAFVDGNKRIGHAALETFLVLNGYEIEAPVDEQERLILEVAGGNLPRAGLGEWLKSHVRPIPSGRSD